MLEWELRYLGIQLGLSAHSFDKLDPVSIAFFTEWVQQCLLHKAEECK